MDFVKYLSVEVVFTTVLSQSIGCRCYLNLKRSQKQVERNFSNFIDLQEKKQVWQILPNLTKVAGFIPCNYMLYISP